MSALICSARPRGLGVELLNYSQCPMGQTSAIPFRSSQGVMSSWSEGEESPQLLITTIWICLMLLPCRGWLSAQGEVTSPPCRQDKQACVSPAQVACLSPWPPCTLRRDTRNDTVVLSYKYRDRRFRHSPFCSLTHTSLTLSDCSDRWPG